VFREGAGYPDLNFGTPVAVGMNNQAEAMADMNQVSLAVLVGYTSAVVLFVSLFLMLSGVAVNVMHMSETPMFDILLVSSQLFILIAMIAFILMTITVGPIQARH
jgi:hypothetical protein